MIEVLQMVCTIINFVRKTLYEWRNDEAKGSTYILQNELTKMQREHENFNLTAISTLSLMDSGRSDIRSVCHLEPTWKWPPCSRMLMF